MYYTSPTNKRRRVEIDSTNQNESQEEVSENYSKCFILKQGYTCFSSIKTLEQATSYLDIEESLIEEARWSTEDLESLAAPVSDELFSKIEIQCKEVIAELQPWYKQTEYERTRILDRVVFILMEQYDHPFIQSEQACSKMDSNSNFLLSSRGPLVPVIKLKTNIVLNHLGQLFVMLNAAGFINWKAGYKNIQTMYGILTDVCDWIFVKYDIDAINGAMKDIKYSETMRFPAMRRGADRRLCELLNGILKDCNEKAKNGKLLKTNEDNCGDLSKWTAPNVVSWIFSEFSDCKFPQNFEEILLEHDIRGRSLYKMKKNHWMKLGCPLGTALEIVERIKTLKKQEDQTCNVIN